MHRVFEHQYRQNPVYHRFCDALGADISAENPPLLPIRAFKEAKVTCFPDREPEVFFESSGTSGMRRSRHQVADAELYRASLLKGFRHFYPSDHSVIWAYTPGYAENPHSSLIWMLRELIDADESGMSKFLPLGRPLDKELLNAVERSGKQLILFGAAFGLVELAERYPQKLPAGSIVIETGGMKTHRREMTRHEMHQKFSGGFGIPVEQVHSEYGMTELLSQAYATGGEWFRPVPWMQVRIYNPENPLELLPAGQEGLIGIIDLANVHSCSFLLTGDRGVQGRKGRFRILGRWNPKDLRGCNFLVEED